MIRARAQANPYPQNQRRRSGGLLDKKARRDGDQSAGQFGFGDHGGAEIAPFRLYNPHGRRVFLKEKTRRCGWVEGAGGLDEGGGGFETIRPCS